MIAVTVCRVCGVVDKTSSTGWSIVAAPNDGSRMPSFPRGTGVNNTRQWAIPAVLRPDVRKWANVALDHLPLDPAALALGEPAPDAEPLVVLQRVLEALRADLTAPADPLGLPGGTALLREERLRIRLRAERLILPTQVINIFRTDDDVR
jgi:hypothetical protein